MISFDAHIGRISMHKIKGYLYLAALYFVIMVKFPHELGNFSQVTVMGK